MPEARKVLTELKSRGYKLVLITNQPDIPRGLVTKFFVENVNRFLEVHLELDLIKMALESDSCKTNRYKPSPIMILEAANELGLDLKKSYIVGDSWKDIGAGISAGCKTILFESQNIENPRFDPDFKIKTLRELLNIIN